MWLNIGGKLANNAIFLKHVYVKRQLVLNHELVVGTHNWLNSPFSIDSS